jgi:hypothetical protein
MSVFAGAAAGAALVLSGMTVAEGGISGSSAAGVFAGVFTVLDFNSTGTGADSSGIGESASACFSSRAVHGSCVVLSAFGVSAVGEEVYTFVLGTGVVSAANALAEISILEHSSQREKGRFIEILTLKEKHHLGYVWA